MADAGTLGALLALIDLESNDVASVRDAMIALSQMVRREDIRKRFLQAPNGLARVFEVLASPNLSLKNTALQVPCSVCLRPSFPPWSSGILLGEHHEGHIPGLAGGLNKINHHQQPENSW